MNEARTKLVFVEGEVQARQDTITRYSQGVYRPIGDLQEINKCVASFICKLYNSNVF